MKIDSLDKGTSVKTDDYLNIKGFIVMLMLNLIIIFQIVVSLKLANIVWLNLTIPRLVVSKLVSIERDIKIR